MRAGMPLLCPKLVVLLAPAAIAAGQPALLDRLLGQPADIAPSGYLYRPDRNPDGNPPEAWVLLIQYAGLPFDRPVDPRSPALRGVLGGLLWEEVRPLRRLVLSWRAGAKERPAP